MFSFGSGVVRHGEMAGSFLSGCWNVGQSIFYKHVKCGHTRTHTDKHVCRSAAGKRRNAILRWRPVPVSSYVFLVQEETGYYNGWGTPEVAGREEGFFLSFSCLPVRSIHPRIQSSLVPNHTNSNWARVYISDCDNSLLKSFWFRIKYN